MIPNQAFPELKPAQPAQQESGLTLAERIWIYSGQAYVEAGIKNTGFAELAYGPKGENFGRYAKYHPEYFADSAPVNEAPATVDTWEQAQPFNAVTDLAEHRNRSATRLVKRIGGDILAAAAVTTALFSLDVALEIKHAPEPDGEARIIDPLPTFVTVETAPESSVITIEPQTTVEVDETEPEPSVVVTEAPATTLELSTTAALTTEAATTTTSSTTTSTTSSTTTTVAPTTTTTVEMTTTIPQPSDGEMAVRSILGGESLLAHPGVQVASMEIPAIGLNGADVFISNDLPVPKPGEPYYDLVMQFDYNQDGVIGKVKDPATGVTLYDEYADFQRAQSNPIYRLETDTTPDDDSFLVGAVGLGNFLRSNRQSYGSWGANGDKPEFRANHYIPTVAIDTASAIPGEAGNVVIFGHRTTESAPFAALNVVQVGDTITFRRADGLVFTYRMVDFDRIWAGYTPAELQAAQNQILNYSNPDSTHTATLYACDPQGSSDYRIVYRFVLDEISATVTSAPPTLPPITTTATVAP